MKKVFVLLLLILMIGCVFAVEAPDPGIGGEDVEGIQQVVDTYSPLDGSGNLNTSKYTPLKSKAEERIDNVNLWLEENASWLSAVLGMVPSLTWLFAINIFLILLYLVTFVFNGTLLASLFSVLDNKIDLMFFETRWSNLLGFIFFIGLIVTKLLVLLAEFILELFGVLWNKVLPWGMAIAVILVILVIVGFILLLIFAPQVLLMIGKVIKKRKEKKAAEKEETNREALGKLVEGATGS